MNVARNWGLAFLGTTVVVVGGYLWLDRPIAHFAHDRLAQYDLFEKLTLLPEWITPLAAVAFLALGLRGLTGRALTRFETVILLTGVSLTVAVAIKDQLKYAFGRTWPETWVRNNLSYIHDNVFGFFPFHGGPGYASFPSGHTTAICAVVSVLWICYPKFRALYVLSVAAVAIGLVGADFHFFSDVIAGGFLGSFTGWFIITVWEIGVRPVRPIGPHA
jgi:membrane-associated phospholipid phosphatase